jgi:hypothetical protein
MEAPVVPSGNTSFPAILIRGSGARTDLADGEGESTLPNRILFTTFFHPFVCTFINIVNRYGVPQLLTLANQALTNDNAVLSGFVPSLDPNTLNASLSPGILVANGEIYQIVTPTSLPPLPGGVGNFFVYWNSNQFYYSDTPPPSPAGDPYLGCFSLVPAVAGGGIILEVTGSTVFELQYQPNPAVISRDTFPREKVDFSFNGAYSIYNWELFFHIPLLIATRLSQNQQFQDSEKWFRYMFNPTISSSDPIPQRYWTCLPFHECAPWDEIAGQIQNLLYPATSGGTGGPSSLC